MTCRSRSNAVTLWLFTGIFSGVAPIPIHRRDASKVICGCLRPESPTVGAAEGGPVL
jgi:hypothetical protein